MPMPALGRLSPDHHGRIAGMMELFGISTRSWTRARPPTGGCTTRYDLRRTSILDNRISPRTETPRPALRNRSDTSSDFPISEAPSFGPGPWNGEPGSQCAPDGAVSSDASTAVEKIAGICTSSPAAVSAGLREAGLLLGASLVREYAATIRTRLIGPQHSPGGGCPM
jgi:hypothetical protein